MKTIAILHTTPATVPLLGNILKQKIENLQIYNFVDDSILPMLKENPESINYGFEKMLTYATFAQRQNVHLILNACSSMGGFNDYAAEKLSVPLVRIDDPVTDELANTGENVAILATFPGTLTPSLDIVKRKLPADKTAEIFLLEKAYELSTIGNKKEHDKIIAGEIKEKLASFERVFLAQASMADAVKLLSEEEQKKVYTSVPYAVRFIQKLLSTEDLQR